MNEVMNTESQLPAEQKLSQLAAEINAIKEQVRETVYLSTCRIGEKLLLAKGAVGHGNWGQWLKDNVDYSERTAQNIITIYKNFNNKETKLFGMVPDAELLGKLNQSQLLALSSIKDEEKRTEFMEEHKEELPGMSKQELTKALAELKEAKETVAKKDSEVKALQRDLSRADKQHEAMAQKVEKYQNLFEDTKSQLEEAKKASIETTTVTVEKMPEDKAKQLEMLQARVAELEAAKPERTPEEKQLIRHYENIRTEIEALLTQLSYMEGEKKYNYGMAVRSLMKGVLEMTSWAE
nr:MAG TPA: Protein of unknown function (DUF3102) [Caudoviricetes sp.]